MVATAAGLHDVDEAVSTAVNSGDGGWMSPVLKVNTFGRTECVLKA
jgi:hypothetical protein